MKTNSIYMVVTDGDSAGNNPVRLQDTQGYQYLLWSQHANKLGLKKGMTGRLVFIKQEDK